MSTVLTQLLLLFIAMIKIANSTYEAMAFDGLIKLYRIYFTDNVLRKWSDIHINSILTSISICLFVCLIVHSSSAIFSKHE